MLSMNDLTTGMYVVIDGDPFELLHIAHLHMGRGSGSVQTRIKNLRTGQVYERNYKPADQFGEADIEKVKVKFIYANRGEFWFTPSEAEGFNKHSFGGAQGKQNRFSLKGEVIGETGRFLKANTEVTPALFNQKIINIIPPIKMDLKVVEAPPAVRGNTAQGGNKLVKLESGAEVQAPLFINEGDILRINTTTGEYVERMEKGLP